MFGQKYRGGDERVLSCGDDFLVDEAGIVLKLFT